MVKGSVRESRRTSFGSSRQAADGSADELGTRLVGHLLQSLRTVVWTHRIGDADVEAEDRTMVARAVQRCADESTRPAAQNAECGAPIPGSICAGPPTPGRTSTSKIAVGM